MHPQAPGDNLASERNSWKCTGWHTSGQRCARLSGWLLTVGTKRLAISRSVPARKEAKEAARSISASSRRIGTSTEEVVIVVAQEGLEIKSEQRMANVNSGPGSQHLNAYVLVIAYHEALPRPERPAVCRVALRPAAPSQNPSVPPTKALEAK
ncbi:hypothetical protein GGTG_00448 [Gaeumannomyces tritici R3-111a-1]|uniref:Uncharacterized protein n=1 Tax=Gaeumannomyces tritici (strain R3-111a-1) TaxID=644352 RepID=J3NGQ9_GAET3|nr:hypothetical protein GGTG_00448 [Gaeumannomyces tritici R3-111a-1]EJT80449.1 hypothetical protein GGTG_00448 [Gaeumannomyces tritici R3-111a-1]